MTTGRMTLRVSYDGGRTYGPVRTVQVNPRRAGVGRQQWPFRRQRLTGAPTLLDAASWAGRLGGESFLAQTYHRSYAHFPRVADTVGLFSWDDLNRIIATQRLEPPRLR